MDKAEVAKRSPDLWRYRELLPVVSEQNIVSMGEGMTPLLELNRLGDAIGMTNLYLKDEGVIPTGTFKARGRCRWSFAGQRTGRRDSGHANQW